MKPQFIIFACLLTLLLYVSGLFVVLTPLPLAYAALKGGKKQGLIVSLLTTGLLLALYQGVLPWFTARPDSHWISLLLTLPGFGFLELYGPKVVFSVGMLYFTYYLILAWLLVDATSRQWGVEKMFLVLTAAPLLICLCLVMIISWNLSYNIFIESQKYLLYIQDKLITLDQSSGLSSDKLAFLKQFGEQMVSRIVSLLPAIIINIALFVVWCNLFVARRWLGKVMAYSRLGDLTRWRLQDQWIWVLIGSAAFFFINLYLIESITLGTLVSNVLLVLLFIYFFQGLSIVSYYLQKRSSLFLRFFVYFIIFIFFQFAAVFMITLGVFDFWADLRKLRKGTKEST